MNIITLVNQVNTMNTATIEHTSRIAEFQARSILFKDEEIFRRTILMASWNNEVVDLINDYLFTNESCGRVLSHYKSDTIKTFMRVPLIHDSDRTIPYSAVICDDGEVRRDNFNKYIAFKGEIPVATEIVTKDYSILSHEIAVGEINLESIIDKYKQSWSFLNGVFVYPMQANEYPVIIWGWSEEIEIALTLLSWKEAKLIEMGRIKLVPLEILMETMPEYFETIQEDKVSLFSFK